MNVVSVVNIGEGLARWTFDTATTAVPSFDGGLRTDGNVASNLSSHSATQVDADYGGGASPGDPWTVVLPTTGLTFAGGKTLTAQSGTIS